MAKRMTRAERDAAIARNQQRLDEVNGWLKGLELDKWEVHGVAGTGGFILGVYMTYRPTHFTICAMSRDDITRVEAEQARPAPGRE